MMFRKRAAAAVFGLAAYALSIATIAYLIGFVGDLPLPRTVNRGAGPVAPPLLVNLLLILAFGVQHSVMARPAFKARLSRVLPPHLERSAFGLASSVMLILLFWLWRPIPMVVWEASAPWAVLTLKGLFWLAWGTAVATTFAVNHPYLFGLSQLADYMRLRKLSPPALRTPAIYRLVRHPMTASLIVAFWATPRMTYGHLVLAMGMTAYSLIGTVFEERDLLRMFGERFRQYLRQVPALVPGWSQVVRGSRGVARRATFLIGLTLVMAALAATAALSPPADRPLSRGGGLVGNAVEPVAPGGVELTFDVGGRVRRAVLFVPADLPPEAPLVLAFHGSGGRPERLRLFLGGELERLGEAHAFAVVYPEAVAGRWNECRRVAAAVTRSLGVDDVGFSRQLIRHLTDALGTDPRRVYVLGYSGGGHMAHRLALEAPDLVAGVVVAGANLPTDSDLACEPGEGGTRTVVIAGTADLINPYGGGQAIAPTGQRLGTVRSAEASSSLLAARAGAGGVATPATVSTADLTVVRHTWERDGCPVVALFTVHGGGHSIPGASGRFPRIVGRSDRAFPALAEALGFLDTAASCDTGAA